MRYDYEHKFNAAKSDKKWTWRIINNIISTKNCKVENTVEKKIDNDVVHVDSGDIANMFNDYVVDIGRNIAESIGGNNANHLETMKQFWNNFISTRHDTGYI